MSARACAGRRVDGDQPEHLVAALVVEEVNRCESGAQRISSMLQGFGNRSSAIGISLRVGDVEQVRLGDGDRGRRA